MEFREARCTTAIHLDKSNPENITVRVANINGRDLVNINLGWIANVWCDRPILEKLNDEIGKIIVELKSVENSEKSSS